MWRHSNNLLQNMTIIGLWSLSGICTLIGTHIILYLKKYLNESFRASKNRASKPTYAKGMPKVQVSGDSSEYDYIMPHK